MIIDLKIYDEKMDRCEQAKKSVGQKAADLIENGMIVGLGTGTTAYWFIESLSARCKKNLKIQAVASSSSSLEQALKGGIPILDINTLTSIDITVDGADEIDAQKRMIKGRGGALLKEKIIASMSREVIIIVDETKLVSKLGKCPLPVEILPFGYLSTIHKLETLGFSGQLRQKDNTLLMTENGNYIYDISLSPETTSPFEHNQRIIQVPGVIETGFFLELTKKVMVGFLDGRVQMI